MIAILLLRSVNGDHPIPALVREVTRHDVLGSLVSGGLQIGVEKGLKRGGQILNAILA